MTVVRLQKTLDLSLVPTARDLASLVKSDLQYDPFASSIELKLKWGSLILNLNLSLDRPSLHPGANWVGRTVEEDIVVINHRGANKELHGGGIMGTIFHEFAHVLTNIGSTRGVGNWSPDGQKKSQTCLFNKWKVSFGDTYASTDPSEATAEVFRALWGYYDPADDHWAYNYSLINEWKIFLKKDAMFKHFLP